MGKKVYSNKTLRLNLFLIFFLYNGVLFRIRLEFYSNNFLNIFQIFFSFLCILYFKELLRFRSPTITTTDSSKSGSPRRGSR